MTYNVFDGTLNLAQSIPDIFCHGCSVEPPGPSRTETKLRSSGISQEPEKCSFAGEMILDLHRRLPH